MNIRKSARISSSKSSLKKDLIPCPYLFGDFPIKCSFRWSVKSVTSYTHCFSLEDFRKLSIQFYAFGYLPNCFVNSLSHPTPWRCSSAVKYLLVPCFSQNFNNSPILYSMPFSILRHLILLLVWLSTSSFFYEIKPNLFRIVINWTHKIHNLHPLYL